MLMSDAFITLHYIQEPQDQKKKKAFTANVPSSGMATSKKMSLNISMKFSRNSPDLSHH
jgi:hypothetical protein